MNIYVKSPEKAAKLAVVLKNVAALADTLTIHFNPDGLHAQGLDSSHICMFELRLAVDWFDAYEVEEGSDGSVVGLSMGIIAKLVGARQPKQSMRLGYANDKFEISFESDGVAGEFNKSFSVPCIDIDCEMMEIPARESEVDAVISTTTLTAIVHQMSIFGDCVEIQCNDEMISINTDGNEGSMKVGLTTDDMEEYAVVEGLTMSQSFALRYMSILCTFHKINPTVRFGLSTDMPVEMCYSMDEEDTTTDSTPNCMKLYLAPKIADFDE